MIDSEGKRLAAGRLTERPREAGRRQSNASVADVLRLRLAGLAILWERIWPALWPAIGLVGLFLVLALADLFRAVPGWLHAVVLAIFAAGVIAALGRAAWRIRLPGIVAARRRLERASGLAHRPLTALADRLANGSSDPAAAALWQTHLARMAAATRREPRYLADAAGLYRPAAAIPPARLPGRADRRADRQRGAGADPWREQPAGSQT